MMNAKRFFFVMIGLAVALGLIFFLVPQFMTDTNRDTLNSVLIIATVLVTGLTLIILLLASIIYRQNYLIVTNKNLTQVLQRGLFRRQVSELSMANVEDVSASQRGIFATLFNFGTLNVETAGEIENFEFPYCPRPNYYGKIILDARQQYIETNPAQAMRENERLNLPPTFQVPPAAPPPPPMPPAPATPPVPPEPPTTERP